VKYPRYEPAAFADYEGDKLEAFWHFDEEMARAVRQYHVNGIRPGQEHSIFRPAGLFEQLWPLGEPMDDAFRVRSPKERADRIRGWIAARTGIDRNSAVARRLAEGIAGGITVDDRGKIDEASCRKSCLRICYAYDDVYRPIENAIDETDLTEKSKDVLRSHYAELMLVLWPSGRKMPSMPLRVMQERIAMIPTPAQPKAVQMWLQKAPSSDRKVTEYLYGKASFRRPANLEGLLADLRSSDTEVGWTAVDEIGKIGPAAIPDLVCLMDFGGPPANFRAAAALGAMGKRAQPALPDLRRSTLRGGTTEHGGLLSRKSLEAIKKIGNNGG
jgi:hypothetical protein